MKPVKVGLLLGVLLALMPVVSHGQQYPTKPINVLVTFAAGGTMDISTRALASKAEKFLGQPFVITNNGGGGGTVGLGIVAKERPDGYHLVAPTSSGFVRIPHFRPVAYKLEDFVPIMHFGAPQSGLVVRADSPWKSLKEFVEYAKHNPGKVTYGTLGVGSAMQHAMEYIAKKEGIQWTHVPYPGSAPALTALLGGHITAQSGDSTWIPHVKEGRLRLLAMHGDRRLKAFPEVPTLREQGYDFINETVFMIAAPKGTPPAIVKKLDEALRRAMDDPEFLQTMAKLEIEPSYRNSEETKKYLQEAYGRVGKLTAELKLPRDSEKKQ